MFILDPDNPPTKEPTELRIGDTWMWDRNDLSNYPASIWTLSYTFINSTDKIEITAAANDDNFRVSEDEATTAAYTKGTYDWIAQVTDGTSVYTVDNGTMEVLPDLASLSTEDTRTHAKIMLDGIEAALEGRKSKTHLSTSINGQSITLMTHEELIKAKNYYQSIYNQQIGKDSGGIIRVAFQNRRL